MCDETTAADSELFLNRRALGVGAGAVAATWLAGCKPSPSPSASPTPLDPGVAAVGPVGRRVEIETPDGTAEGFFVAPAQGKHPGVLIWPDIAGLRPAFEAVATRLAGEGYAVLAVNQYYRSAQLPILETFDAWRTDEGQAKIRPMIEPLTPTAVSRDGAAFVKWLDQQPQVDLGKKTGTAGYCMGGPFTFRTAAAAPERVGALGSFHGGGLVTDAADSPHLLLATMKAAALVCVARNDDERQPEAKVTLQDTAKTAGVPAEVEVYPAQHGWCVPDSPVYDQAQAQRAWDRLLATLQQHL